MNDFQESEWSEKILQLHDDQGALPTRPARKQKLRNLGKTGELLEDGG